MKSRTFAVGLVAGAVSLFVATMLTNIVLDPQMVFGTRSISQPNTANDRYERYLAYRRDASEIDGAIFSSSRGGAFDVAEMAQLTGARHVMPFAFKAGSVFDHLPFLEYIVNDKAARGERLRRVLVLLDPDAFGAVPWTNHNLDGFLPPAISGESKIRFWMRYLVAVQFRGWRESLRLSLAGWQPAKSTPAGAGATNARPVDAIGFAPAAAAANAFTRIEAKPTLSDQQSRSGPSNVQNPVVTVAASPFSPLKRKSRSIKPFLESELAMLERLVALCRENQIQLTVAIDPLSAFHQESFEPGHVQAIIDRINNVTDIWDFSSPPWLADDGAFWYEVSHFKPEVAAMMLRRMYGTGEGVPTDFGRFRARTTTAAAIRR